MNDSSVTISKPFHKSLKKIWLTIIFVIINVVVIGYTAIVEFSKDRPDSVGIEFGIKNVFFFVCAFLCLAAVLMLETSKYLLMMRSLKEKVSLKHAFQVAALGKYYDSLTPSGAGGQPFQIWYLNANGFSSGASAAMPLSAFVTMQCSFAILAIIVLVFNYNAIDSTAIKISSYLGIFLYLFVPFLIILFAITPKGAGAFVNFFISIGAKLHIVKSPEEKKEKIISSLFEYRFSLITIAKEKFLLIKLMFLSFLYQIALCSIPYFVIHAFDGNLTYINVLSVCVFIYAAIACIPTPGNSGAAEGSFYALFSPLGTNCLFWAMLIWRFICYYSFLIIGVLIYGYNAFMPKHTKKVNKKNEYA